MAELHVQPKKKSSILPWILLLLGVAALIWYLTRDKDTDTAPVTTDTTTTIVQQDTTTTIVQQDTTTRTLTPAQ